MMRLISSASSKMKPVIQNKIEQVFASGRITRREHLDLTSALLADCAITESDRLQINQILESVQVGKLKLME